MGKNGMSDDDDLVTSMVNLATVRFDVGGAKRWVSSLGLFMLTGNNNASHGISVYWRSERCLSLGHRNIRGFVFQEHGR